MQGKHIIYIALASLIFAGVITNIYQTEKTEQSLFQEWVNKVGVQFSAQQTFYRMRIFSDNVKKINEHNSKLGASHEQGLNQFVFLTHDQFVAQYLSTFQTPQDLIIQQSTQKQITNGPTIDWVSYGAVSPVLNQGQCTASYAFSAIGAVEGLSVIFYQRQVTYSVQQMIDCTGSYGNKGCATGTMQPCFSYIKDKGVADSSSYPYIGYATPCKISGGNFRVGAYSSVKDCTSLANSLAYRPVSVAVDGNNFQFYKSGIFNNCGYNLSLAALVVGMNDSSWTLKNSWGTTWGQNGYIRISRGNTCGVCQFGSYPNTL